MPENNLHILELSQELVDNFGNFVSNLENIDSLAASLLHASLKLYAATATRRMRKTGHTPITWAPVDWFGQENYPIIRYEEDTEDQEENFGTVIITGEGTAVWYPFLAKQMSDILRVLNHGFRYSSSQNKDEFALLLLKYNLLYTDIARRNSEIRNRERDLLTGYGDYNKGEEETYLEWFYKKYGLLPVSIVGESIAEYRLNTKYPHDGSTEVNLKLAGDLIKEADEKARKIRTSDSILSCFEKAYESLPLYGAALELLGSEVRHFDNSSKKMPDDLFKDYQIAEEKMVVVTEVLTRYGHSFIIYPILTWIKNHQNTDFSSFSEEDFQQTIRREFKNYAISNPVFPKKFEKAWEDTIENILDLETTYRVSRSVGEFLEYIETAVATRVSQLYEDPVVWGAARVEFDKTWKHLSPFLMESNTYKSIYAPLNCLQMENGATESS